MTEIQYQGGGMSPEQPVPTIVKYMIRFSGGLIENEKQAEGVAMVFFAVCLAVPLFYWAISNHQKPPSPPDMEKHMNVHNTKQ